MHCTSSELISVIVPHYKVGKKYTDRCILSICNQSYTNLEIIIIDDGNESDTARWLDTLGNIDTRIKVIHQRNQGVSAARNLGIELSKGTWIYFCDPDDYMHENEIEHLYNTACRNNADIVICGYSEINFNDDVVNSNKLFDNSVTNYENGNIQLLALELITPGINKSNNKADLSSFGLVYPWAHLYHKSIIADIKFPSDLHPGEDLIFNLYVLKNAKKVTLISQMLHYYRIEGGVTHTYSKKYLDNSLKRKHLLYVYIDEQLKGKIDNCIIAKIEMNQLSALCNNYFFHKDNNSSYFLRRKELKQFLTENAVHINGLDTIRYFTLKQKIIYLILKLHAYFMLEIWRKLRKC